jgi:predicted transposase
MKTETYALGKLYLTQDDFIKLEDTIKTFRDVCNHISKVAYNERCFNAGGLHHLTYKDVRMKYSLPANLVIRARDKVVNTYKKSRKKEHFFKGLSMDLDQRVLSIKVEEETYVTIATIEKRVKAKIIVEKSQKELLKQPIRTARVILRDNDFYLEINVSRVITPIKNL